MSPKHLNFSHSCCGGEQFLYERNLGADQCYSNLSEEIQFWGWWGHHSYLSRRKSFGSFQPKMTWEQGIGWFGFRLCSSVFLMVSVLSNVDNQAFSSLLLLLCHRMWERHGTSFSNETEVGGGNRHVLCKRNGNTALWAKGATLCRSSE